MSAIRNVLMASIALTMTSTAFAQDVSVLRIGLDGSENEADQIRKTECVAEGLKVATGVPEVQIFPSPDYNGVIQGLLGGTIDIASMGASSYAAIVLQDPAAVDPILTTAGADGSTGYYSLLVARKDKGYTKLADLKGKKLGFADPDSTSGYLVPNVSLPADIGGPVAEFFGETGFGGGHENLVLGVLDGTWDAGTTFGSGVGEWAEGYTTGNLTKMVEKGILDMDDIVEVWKSPLIPNGPIVVRTSLDDGIKTKFKQFMIDLPKTDKACFSAIQGGDFTGFTEVTPEFYQPIIDARKAQIGS